MTAVKARACAAATHCFGIDCSVDLMYYIILFVGVLSLLALAAWRLDPSRRQTLARATGQGTQAVDAAGDFAARLLRGERKEDKPCLTPIDCVRTKRCAGHCGCR